MKIGYSFWGFLGEGITDTPDGGRSHRRTLVDGLRSLGHEIVFLQANRDLIEAGTDLRDRYRWEPGYPAVDLLFVEWRWPILGRNTTACGTAGHTCDLHRQGELLAHYTRGQCTPTVVWDKDVQLPRDHPLRYARHVTICEAALHPGPGAISLLFPVADTALDTANPAELARLPRDLPLVYVGNQYDRDGPFDCFFAPVAASFSHQVAGKWTDTSQWPHVRFTGRVPFASVEALHRRALATMLLAPDRLAVRGQFTQRIFEAVLAGCLPLAPAYLRSVERVVPSALIVENADRARAVLSALTIVAGSALHIELLTACLRRLDSFRLSRQLVTLERLFHGMTGHVQAVRS